MSTPNQPPPRPNGASAPPQRAHPHNLDAERAVLGAMLLDNAVIPDVTEHIQAEDFYQIGHQVVFKAMLELYNTGKPVDLTLLVDELRRTGRLDEVGGYLYVASLEQFVMATSAAPSHAAMVRDKATMRRLMSAAETILHETSEERHDVTRQVDIAEKLIFQVSQTARSSTFRSVEDLMPTTLKEIGILHESRGGSGAEGIPTGYLDLDRYLGGLKAQELLVLAARPSIGKTAFALNIVRNVAVSTNRAVGFFSLEMGAEALNVRLLCAEAKVPSHKVRRGSTSEEEWARLRETAGRLEAAPIHIDDSAGLSVMQVRSRARRLKSQYPTLGLIVIDYLQLMSGTDRSAREANRQQEVSEISRGLKALARELSVPVIALSQLSRNIENRGTKEKAARPMLSDLRESGAIEQDADVVMFVHRERLEVAPATDGKLPDRSLPIPTDIIVAKNRNGPIGTAQLLFLPDLTRFVSKAKE